MTRGTKPVQPLRLSSPPLEERLASAGKLTRDQAKLIASRVAEAKKRGQPVTAAELIVSMELIGEDDLANWIAETMPADLVDCAAALAELDAAARSDLTRKVQARIAREHFCCPMARQIRTLVVAVTDPANLEVIAKVQFASNGFEIIPVVAPVSAIRAAIDELYGASVREASTAWDLGFEGDVTAELEDETDDDDAQADLGSLDDISEEVAADLVVIGVDEPGANAVQDMGESTPVSKMVNRLILEARNRRASDIHIEGVRNRLRIRLRVDGQLGTLKTMERNLQAPLISRLKVMAKLNINETRLPQDGRIRIKAGKTTLDVRLATTPTTFGEKAVMRLLDPANMRKELRLLGASEWGLEQIQRALALPYGLIVISGPTGSGKTTSLYTMLHELNRGDRNIMTIEDPIEYEVTGLNQVQVNPATDLTFARGLRSFLRCDPDVMLVGELRDEETARIAAQASMTGHLVLSTVHANDAPSTVMRMLDLGVQRYQVADIVTLIVAQRLARRVCDACAEPDPTAPAQLVAMGVPNPESYGSGFRRGTGLLGPGIPCPSCGGRRYAGRHAIHEVLAISHKMKEILRLPDTSVDEVRALAIREGNLQTLRDRGIALAAAGVTDLEEVRRVTIADAID